MQNHGSKDEILVRGRGLVKSFNGNLVLDAVDLNLHKGECVVLEGENGSGKTTLLNILSGIVQPDSGALEFDINGLSSAFHFPPRLLSRFAPLGGFSPERAARVGLGRSWQEVRLFRTENLEDNLMVAAREQIGESPLRALIQRARVRGQEASIARAAREMLAAFGLAGRERSSADKVSYGQAKRVAILRAMLGGAKVLLLDEPLAGLDQSGTAEMLGFLREIRRKQEVTTVIVEHHLHLAQLLGLATSVWRLADGRLSHCSAKDRFAELQAESPEAGQPPTWMKTMVKPGDQVCQRQLAGGAVLTSVRQGHVDENQRLLELEGLTIQRGHRSIFGPTGDASDRSLSFSLCRGEMAVLEAPNGWGKTSLLECIAGPLSPSGGRIIMRGQPIGGLSTWERRQAGIAFLSNRQQCFPNLSVRDYSRLAGVHDENSESFAGRTMSTLSAGERQRLRVRTLLASNRDCVYLLDEPFSALDAATLSRVQEAFPHVLEHGAILIALPRA